MQIYLLACAFVNFILALVNTVTFLPTFKALTPEIYQIGTAIFALSRYAASYIYAKPSIINFVFKKYYIFLTIEAVMFVCISLFVFHNDASDISLIIRWIYLGSIGDILASTILLVWEKYKEINGDGSTLEMRSKSYKEFGVAVGTCMAVLLLLGFKYIIPINIGFLMQGTLCILENIALIFLIKKLSNKENLNGK